MRTTFDAATVHMVQEYRALADEMVAIAREESAAEIQALRDELRNQWEWNHAEHCGHEPPLHDGECFWPLPAVLRANS